MWLHQNIYLFQCNVICLLFSHHEAVRLSLTAWTGWQWFSGFPCGHMFLVATCNQSLWICKRYEKCKRNWLIAELPILLSSDVTDDTKLHKVTNSTSNPHALLSFFIHPMDCYYVMSVHMFLQLHSLNGSVCECEVAHFQECTLLPFFICLPFRECFRAED